MQPEQDPMELWNKVLNPALPVYQVGEAVKIGMYLVKKISTNRDAILGPVVPCTFMLASTFLPTCTCMHKQR